MLDRAGGYSRCYSNELFRFSTTKMQWEQLNASNGSSPSARYSHRMVAVGNDSLYVLGGHTGTGDIDDAMLALNRLGACQIERRRCSARRDAAWSACWHMLCSSGMPCRAAPKSGDSGRHITPLLAP
jgi:hypothetical protein